MTQGIYAHLDFRHFLVAVIFIVIIWAVRSLYRFQTDQSYCVLASDCIPVACECHCSGCGGFSYEEIINKEHLNEWYEQHHCSPPVSCPNVCCQPMEIVCHDNRCKVKFVTE
jgi:hypothetical protein